MFDWGAPGTTNTRGGGVAIFNAEKKFNTNENKYIIVFRQLENGIKCLHTVSKLE